MGDRQLGFRVSEETAEKVDNIVDSLNKSFPAKRIKTSDVLRSAIEVYVEQAQEEKDNLFVKLPCNKDLTVKEATALLEGMRHIQEAIKSDSVDEAVSKFKERLEYAEFLEWKANKEGGNKVE